ncbi:MAG: LytTR family DNA-binding domain-containing protein, partial [Bacteroidota bacterium]
YNFGLFSVENETVYLYTFQNDRYPLYKKMEYIESVCDPQQFFRINRQMLVSRKAIDSFEPYFNRKVILNLNVKVSEQAIVSRLKVTPFKQWLEQ